MNKTILFSLLTVASLFGADNYKSCGDTRNDALANLSSAILSNVSTNFRQSTTSTSNGSDENIDQKIDYMLNVSSNLSLVNQIYSQENNQTCVTVDKKDQVENTQLRLTNVMQLKQENLPENIDQRLTKLKDWLEEIQQVNNLIMAFLKPSNGAGDIEEIIANLQKKEKTFTDLYTNSILKANSLVFKACEETREEAYEELNKQLFKSKTKKQDDEGILDKTASFFAKINPFGKKEEKMLDLFSKQVTYLKNDKKECALIEKDELLSVAMKLNMDVQRFTTNSFSKSPKERYTQIKDYQEHLNVTKALIELFPEKFSNNDFNRITSVKKELLTELETTHPQSIEFIVVGGEDIKIKLNDTFVKPHTKLFTKEGKYSYIISAKGKCPIKGEISLDLLSDESIEKDFTSMNYPRLNFYTKEGTSILVDGKNLTPNIETVIEKCEGEVRYLADFGNQHREDTISVSPNMTETIELKFLLPDELAIFNDAKTKAFQTTTQTPFSESLTPLSSKNLEFSVESDCKNGNLELDERGSFTYTSKENFVGVDSFIYIIKANGEKSAPKVVNITVNLSNAPVAPIIAEIKEPVSDLNQTKEKVVAVEEEIKEEVKKVTEKTPEETAKEEERYQKFKYYVEEQELTTEKMEKLQKTYPDLFGRLLKEKTSGL